LSLASCDFIGGEHGFYSQNNFTQGVLASGSEDKTVRIWDMKSNKGVMLMKDEKHMTEDINSVKFMQQGNLLIASSGKKICIFDLRQSKIILNSLQILGDFNSDGINELDVSDNQIAACDDSGEITVVDVNYGDSTMSVVKTLRHKHLNICYSVAINKDKIDEIVSGGFDCKIVLWNMTNPSKTHSKNVGDIIVQNFDKSALTYNPPFVLSVCYMSKDTVIAGLGNGSVATFRTNKMKN